MEFRRQRSKLDLDLAMRQKRAKEEAAKRAEARRVAERDVAARQAQERVAALRESWAETKAVNEVRIKASFFYADAADFENSKKVSMVA